MLINVLSYYSFQTQHHSYLGEALNTDKRDDLLKVIADIQKRWGNHVIGWGSDRTGAGAIATGFTDLDQLLGGGLPRSRATEILGNPTSGMTSLALRVMAAAQRSHEVVVYLDLPAAFDVDYALSCGVDPTQLALVRPAFDIGMEMLFDVIASRIPGCVVVNTLLHLSEKERTLLMQVSERLHPLLAQSNAVLLFLTTPSRPQPLIPYAALRLRVEREEWLYDRDAIHGYAAQVTILKDKSGQAGKMARIAITFGDGGKVDAP